MKVNLTGIDLTLPTATSGIGIVANGDMQLNDVRVSGPGDGTGATGIVASSAVAIDGSSVTGTGLFGIEAKSGHAVLTHTRVSNVRVGVFNGGDEVEIDSSRISAAEIGVSSRGGLVVRGSTVETTNPHSFGIQGTGGGMIVEHVSVAHRGQPDGTDSALDFETVDVPGLAKVSSSAFVGYTRGIRRDNSQTGDAYPLDVRDSVWDSTRDVIGPPSAGAFGESGDAHVAPLVADLAAGDLRPRGSSAAIDRDTKTNAQYVDVAGVQVTDGDGDGTAAADAGALEYRRRAPSIDAAGVPAGGTTGAALPFSATPSDADGDALQTIWSFGDSSVGSGLHVAHVYAAPGLYHASIDVLDEAGLRATRTFTLVVTAGASSPPSGGTGSGAGAGGQGSGPASGGPPPDRAAPRITSLRVVPNPVAVRQAARLRLRFSVSEPAALRIVARLAGAARGRPVRGTIAAHVRAGRASIALGAALRRARVLRPGRWRLAMTATDASGNRSAVRTPALIVRS